MIHSSWFWFTLLSLQGGIFFLENVIIKKNKLPMTYKNYDDVAKEAFNPFSIISKY